MSILSYDIFTKKFDVDYDLFENYTLENEFTSIYGVSDKDA